MRWPDTNQGHSKFGSLVTQIQRSQQMCSNDTVQIVDDLLLLGGSDHKHSEVFKLPPHLLLNLSVDVSFLPHHFLPLPCLNCLLSGNDDLHTEGTLHQPDKYADAPTARGISICRTS